MSTSTKPTDNTPAQTQGAALAKEGPKNPTTIVLNGIQKLMVDRKIVIRAGYSVENALKSAWFFIQNSENKDKILACTQESQVNALYDMVIQGLDVAKKQCYFIPYGASLKLQRSYFGDIKVAQDVEPGITPYFDVVYEGEAVKVTKQYNKYGYVSVIEHATAFPRKSSKIIAAYCGFIDKEGVNMGAELMGMDQILNSWKKSKTYGPNSSTFHNEQPDQACLRTVIRRRCKFIINSSNDEALLASVRRQEMDAIDAEVTEEITENANTEVLGLSEPIAQDLGASQPEPEVVTASAQGSLGEEAPF